MVFSELLQGWQKNTWMRISKQDESKFASEVISNYDTQKSYRLLLKFKLIIIIFCYLSYSIDHRDNYSICIINTAS